MRTFMHRVSFGVALLGLSAASQSAEWVLEPGSQVTFEYSYGTDPYEGRFTNVQANFDIDPMRPTSCKFDVTINIEDIDVDSPEVLDYLLDYELFDVDTWPTATFSAEKLPPDGCQHVRIRRHSDHPRPDQTNDFSFELNIETCDGQVCFHMTSEVEILRLIMVSARAIGLTPQRCRTRLKLKSTSML